MVVAAGPVREAHHAHPLAAVEERHAEERLHPGGAARQAAAPRVARRVVRDDGLAGDDGGTEQRVEVVELDRPFGRAMRLEQRARRLVPADVGVHDDAQEPVAVARVVEHVCDEAVLAAGELQQVGEQRIEHFGGRRRANEPRLHPADDGAELRVRHRGGGRGIQREEE